MRQPPKFGLVFGDIEAFSHSSPFVDQPVLPEIGGEHETVGREVSFSYLIAVEQRLNAMICSLNLDDPAIGRDARAPFRTFAAPKEGLLEQAKVGNAIPA